MQLNDLSPAPGSRKVRARVGRGAGSGMGKTSRRGQKGQGARKSGGVRPGFEGGQMPLQMRVPKFGFRSQLALETAEVRLGELAKVSGELVDLETLRKANLVTSGITRARIMLSGTISRAVTVKGITVTRGARAAIEAAGGKVEA
jgi:large subunit ribosomal protein L15